MSYIPPHKRHLKDPVKPSPVTDSIVTKLKTKLDLKVQGSSSNEGKSLVDYTCKWFLIEPNVPQDEVKLERFSSDSAASRNGEKPLVLLKNNLQKDVEENKEKSEWKLVAEKVEDDLVLAIEKAKKEMKDHHQNVDFDFGKLRLVARFGKLLFYGHEAGHVSKCMLETSKRMFYTNVSTSFLRNIKSKLLANHKFCFDEEKDTYIVKISYYKCSTVTMDCKCILKEDGRLSMYKTEINPVRHLLVDVSCPDKNLDMRLMLATQRKLMTLTEKETRTIEEILESATVDPNVKGGLRWSLGKTSSRGGYSVGSLYHIKATTYTNQTLRLRVREADRFNVSSEIGEVKREVNLILKGINTQLQEENVNSSCVLEMLRDAFPTMWDFLSCKDADVDL